MCSCSDMKDVILNSNEPFVIKNRLNWGLLKWSLNDWSKLLGNEKLQFRCGTNSFTEKPQWERTTYTKMATFEEFLTFVSTKSDEWMYFDYKYLKEWLSDIPELKKEISWAAFGFPEFSGEDSVIWIGSKGAHTPCHMDTYGCNLIAQVYGRKQWLLCPPLEDLKLTRVPYEESSVYSKLNFFSPNIEDFKGVKNCRKVVLEPGEVLFVPHKWWHYVENLDEAISINVWIPLSSDHEERLKESLIQLFISQIAKSVNKEVKDVILNPNSDEDVDSLTLTTSLNLVKTCKNVFKTADIDKGPKSTGLEGGLDFARYCFLQEIPILSNEDFQQFLQDQKSRFNSIQECTEQEDNEELIGILNAFMHPETVSLIKNKLLQP